MKMGADIKTSFILFLVAGVSIAWKPIADDRRCYVYSPAPASTKCGSYRYQYDRKSNLCQPTCSASAPFSSFMECSGNCRSTPYRKCAIRNVTPLMSLSCSTWTTTCVRQFTRSVRIRMFHTKRMFLLRRSPHYLQLRGDVEVCFMHRPLSSCGSGVFPVYYFNPVKDACFVEQGCTYKGNNFPTLAECQRTCRAKTQGPSQVPLGVPGNSGPSQYNTTQSSSGGAPPFIQQRPQSTWNSPMAPQQNTPSWNGGMPPSNQQLGTPGQSSQGMVPPLWNNSAASASSHQQPQQPWNSGVPPTLQSPGSVPPFPTQSGQQTWNGQTVPQAGAQQQWSNGIPPFNPQQQQGTGTMSPYPQQPGQQPWSGQMASPNPPQSPQQQWNNGALPTNIPSTVQQQSGAGMTPTSPLQQLNPLVASGIPPQGTQNQWGNGNLPSNSLQRPSNSISTSSSQQGTQSPWSNAVPVAGQQQNIGQRVNGVVPNHITQPPWNGNSQAGPWSSPLTSGNPQPNAQYQPSGAMSSPSSPNFSQVNPSSQTQQSIKQRVLIRQQTTHQQWRRTSVSTSPG